MKPIDQMTLPECLNAIRGMTCDKLDNIYEYEIASRIHDLTRWIPVSERMPTEEDGDVHGDVLISEVENEYPYRRYQIITRWSFDPNQYHETVTHWQRITPPEGV
jgi:hypothetical protein